MPNLTLAGGSILTMDAHDTFLQQGSLTVRHGAIAAVAAHAAVAGGETIDATRCVIIPGLVNAHTHTFLHMWRALNDDESLFPWLQLLSPAIGLSTAEDMRQSNYLGCMEALLSGTTTLCECCRYNPLITAEVASELGLRSMSGGMPADEWFGEPLPTDLPGLVDKTRYLLKHAQQYHGLACAYLGVHSPYNCTPDFIVEARRRADELGVRFNIHLSETQAEIDAIQARYQKSPVQHLHDLGVLDDKLIANHCVLFDDGDIRLFANSGAGIVHNPVSNAKLWSGIAPVKQYLDSGIPVGLGTDSVVSNNSFNMFEEIKFGLLLQRVRGAATPGDRLGAYDFLKMATIGGARVLGLDQLIGSIEVGKRADLVVIALPPEMPISRHHIISHLAYSTEPQHIRAVVVDGNVVVRDGALQRVDGQALRQKLTDYFQARWVELREQLPDGIFA